jgi:hypothetical protein
MQLPLPILLWSAIGSFTAILYRFNSSGDIELRDPLRWLFTRPLTGIVMGTMAYLAMKIGMLAAVPDKASSLGSLELMWVVAFLGGFSDRFADTLLRSLVGRFGGDGKADLVSLDDLSSSLNLPSIPFLGDIQSRIRERLGKKQEPSAATSPQESGGVSQPAEREQHGPEKVESQQPVIPAPITGSTDQPPTSETHSQA